MKKLLMLLITGLLFGCNQPNYTSNDIVEEWKEKGDNAPLYLKAFAECEDEISRGLSNDEKRACRIAMDAVHKIRNLRTK